MLRRIALTALILTSFTTAAKAGIIGIGGTNALEDPELRARVNSAEEISVEEALYRRISGRISAQGSTTAEIQNSKNEKERAEFIKVYLNNEANIVDTEFRMKLKTAQ